MLRSRERSWHHWTGGVKRKGCGVLVSQLREATATVATTVAALVVSLGVGAYAVGMRPSLDGVHPALSGGDRAAATSAAGADMSNSSLTVTDSRTLPAETTTPSATSPLRSQASSATVVPNCGVGDHQRDVEVALSELTEYGAVVVDGRQSPGDCAAIKRFQQRFGISPVSGQADALTANVARRILASLNPARQAQCQPGSGATACIDLTLQTVWVVRDGRIVLGPTVTRTGFRGHATPAGTFTINRRALREWSNPYEVWLPYWQHFVNGIGFHETTTYIHNAAIGSHGCINLLPNDAKQMWQTLKMGTTVRTFGRRAGT